MFRFRFFKLSNFYVILFLLLFRSVEASVVDGVGDALGISPFESWKVLESEHFRITFPENLTQTAQASAHYLEEAHRLLTPVLLWTPHSKTKVLITDTRDDANGLAAPIAGFGMVLYAVAPENHSSLFNYDNWLRLLCIHEYAHILTSDQTDGIFAVLRSIFGPLLLPNSLWPRWIHEGLATHFETRFTKGGRGRSTQWQGLVRAAVEEGVWGTSQFMTLDRLGGSDKDFPAGEAPYFFGYFILDKLVRSRGDIAIGKYAHRSSSQFPYFLNSYLEETSNLKWRSLWNELTSELKAKAEKEISLLQDQKSVATLSDNILTNKLEKNYPQPNYSGIGISSDEKIWVASIGYANRPREVYVYNKNSDKLFTVNTLAPGTQFTFIPQTHSFLYTDQNLKGPYRHYSDLFLYDVDSQNSVQLTFGKRVKEFDFFFHSNSKSSGWLVFTFEQDSATGLAAASFQFDDNHFAKLGDFKVLLQPEFLSRISTPKCVKTVNQSEDQIRVYFSYHPKDSLAENIYSIPFSAASFSHSDSLPRSISKLEFSAGQSQNRYLSTGPNGEVVFVSNLSGSDQLYLLTGKTAKRIATTTSAFTLPLVTAQGEVFSHRLFATGWKPVKLAKKLPEISAHLSVLHSVPSGGHTNVQANIQANIQANSQVNSQANILADVQTNSSSVDSAASTNRNQSYSIKDENPLKTLAPRFWIPSYRSNLDINTLGGNLHGFDVTHRHAYSLGVEYTFEVNFVGVDASYSYRGFGPTLKPFYNRKADEGIRYASNSYLYFVDEEYGVEAFYPFIGLDFQLTPVMGAAISQSHLYDHRTKSTKLRSGRQTPQGYAGILYSDTESGRLPIYTKEGRNISLLGYTYLPKDRKIFRGAFDYREYLSVSENTVLTPRIQIDFVSRSNRFSNGVIDPDIRGYKLIDYESRQAVVTSLDYLYPILNIFRGWDTRPLFFTGISGSIFGETTALLDFPSHRRYLPSAGAGLHFNMEWFYNIPISLNLTFAHGFRSYSQGGSQWKIELSSTGFQW